MAIETCQLTGIQTAKLVKCDYCGKKVCYQAIKSQKRKKIDHRYICKACWSDMKKRKAFKSAN